jgi:hypothetical protein
MNMGRATLQILVASAVLLVGCQKAKMVGVIPTVQKPSTAAQPPVYYPPTQPVYPNYPPPAQPVLVDQPEAQPAPCMQECEAVPLNARVEAAKLDVLFVVDTSASLRGGHNKGTGGELGQLARDMKYFMQRLDKNTDVRIGMLLGHGPGMTQTHGRLFTTGGNDPAVIDYVRIQEQIRATQPTMGTDDVRALAQQRIGQLLENKMIRMPIEKKGAQGEALLLSLYDAVSRADLREQIRAAGLLRNGVPLAVIMISDEQDVCYDYAANGKKARQEDPIETKFFNNVCARAVNGGPLTPDLVYQALQSVAGDKLIVTGIHYVDNNIPQGVEDENEMGYGFLDLIALANGRVADLAQVDRNSPSFWAQLDDLGRFAEFQRKFTNRFICYNSSGADPANINLSTLEVSVYDQQNKLIGSFGTSQGLAKWQIVTTTKGGRYGRAVISAPALDALLQDQQLTNGYVKIRYSTKY